MIILGIETSCDETSAALVVDGRDVLSNVIASSKEAFASLAGVIPEEAARRQVECMIPVLHEALHEADTPLKEVDAIAVTQGPGLLGSLLVGTSTARALSFAWEKPLVGVHHTLGHLSSPWLAPPGLDAEDVDPSFSFPILTLSASGGHTDLWYRLSHTRGELLARTRDDAAGEAFDKGASILGLPYPGGPSMAATAEKGSPTAYKFPLPLRGEKTLDFSFSGLKTSLKYLLRDNPKAREDLGNVAASFQHAICLQLLDRMERALELRRDVRELHLVGGVSANLYLRSQAGELCKRKGIKLRHPLALSYCTDNAAMIAAAGYFSLTENGGEATDFFDTKASLPLEQTLQETLS
ncbi:MAG: tRNA (adenosine(37)-N6)-threonylcarbamoyltransferase complex transferase subunit TsaD [Candidatus Peribacteraceae bacterium]|jgi:N6-L-threonylcarbamoyladenine synthase